VAPVVFRICGWSTRSLRQNGACPPTAGRTPCRAAPPGSLPIRRQRKHPAGVGADRQSEERNAKADVLVVGVVDEDVQSAGFLAQSGCIADEHVGAGPAALDEVCESAMF